jgi:hypothetical protein
MRQPLPNNNLDFKEKMKCSLAIFCAASSNESSVDRSGVHWTWIFTIGVLQSHWLLDQIVHAVDRYASTSFPGHLTVYLGPHVVFDSDAIAGVFIVNCYVRLKLISLENVLRLL